MDDLYLVCYTTADGTAALGYQQNGVTRALPFGLESVLSGEIGAASLVDRVLSAASTPLALDSVALRAPVVGAQEIWAAGVTYKRSEEAREMESNNSSIYTRVYHASRPEVFFKALGREVVPLGGRVGIRFDATWSVPEAELVVVLNANMEVVGFTIGNDMSSRDIEGENPLYLPQAKVYQDACAVGPRIWLRPSAAGWPDVTLAIRITRAGQTVFEDSTTTASIHRKLDELIDYLGRCKHFASGVMLFTGTGIVPPDNFTLQAGDVVRITIDPIGVLENPVHVVGPRQKA